MDGWKNRSNETKPKFFNEGNKILPTIQFMIFSVPICYIKNIKIQIYDVTSCYVCVWNLFSHIKVRNEIADVWEQDTVENMWTQEDTERDRKLEKAV
jgi:hypothetical protein